MRAQVLPGTTDLAAVAPDDEQRGVRGSTPRRSVVVDTPRIRLSLISVIRLWLGYRMTWFSSVTVISLAGPGTPGFDVACSRWWPCRWF